jgi:opacity protein-like surface antigen
MAYGPRAAAFVAAALLVAASAAAQNRPALSLTPADPADWDIAAHVGWVAAAKPDTGSLGGSFGDDWYSALSGRVSAGRYLTSHLKTEIHAAMNGEGRVYRQDPPSGTVPVFRASEHYFRTAAAGAGLFYQFFENQWFHPYAGAGLELVREEHRIVVLDGRTGSRASVPAEVSHAARPFLATGFKWYVADRAFVRAGVQGSLSSHGAVHIAWTTGFGADL